MAPRHNADSSRYDRDRDRGGGRRYNSPPSRRSRSPPRRDRSRDRDRRDRSRDRGDRYPGSHRDDHYRGSNRNRDSRRDRDSYGRLRSPDRRDRSRDRQSERYRGDRDHDRGRDYGDRDHNRGYNDRDHNDRDRRRRSFSHSSRPGSRASATPGPQNGRDRVDAPRRDEKKKDPEAEAKDKQAEKLARLAEWKKRNAERLTKDKPDTPGSGMSPNVTAPSTPTVATTPSASENKDDTSLAKAKVLQKSATEKLKQKQPEKSTFKLDASATARPLMAKAAGKPVTSAANNTAAQQAKANGNIGSFGLKSKSAVESETAKNSVLGDEDNTGKRKFQALPEFTPNDEAEPTADDADDAEAYAAMSDIGSDDEDAKAQLQAQLEKRREELAAENLVNEDAEMEEAPANDNAGKMDVDETAGAEEDDVDPLDAFMAGLSEPQPTRTAPTFGQAMFNDDLEPEQTSVEAEDLIALKKAANAKKKKKEVPVVDHSKIEYEPFRKDFYVEPAEITQMTTEEIADLRHDLDGIKVKPGNVARPVTKWAQMGLLQATMDVFTKLRFEKPTSIQAQAIPIIESGRDLVGIAKTGSGKTLAFGIPMVRHILDQRPLKSADGPIGLILAPTRELSLQIVAELKPFLNASGLTIKCAYGGSPIADQIAMLKRGGVHVLCATAGRLIDLLASNSGRVLNFKRVTYVVLDEADRMFDMGFEPQVMKILQNVRPDRQTILFSATFPKDMASLARKAMTDSVEATIGGRSKVAPEITQIIDLVSPSYEKKVNRLLWHLGNLFSENEEAQILIFTQRQEVAEDLLSKLFKAKYPLTNAIHGAKEWSDRIEAMNAFKKGDLQILIATSVAARGLDVPGLDMVLNFDCPTHLEDYVHRCGRTGRAGNKGTAVTLVEHPGQERFAVHIVKALKESDTEVPEELQKMADSFMEKVKSGEEKYYGGFGGRGIERLDAARALEKRREKRALKLEDEDESEEEVEVLPKPEVAAKATDEPQADTRPSWMKLLDSKIVVSKTERPDPSTSNKNLTAKEKAALAASKVDGRLSKKGMIHAGQPIDNKGPDAGAYHSTVEINDFPQKARWAVTNRTNVAKILDQTGVSITTKGNYYGAGKEPGENDLPKLYILVEGDTENVVTEAMMELTRLLREGTMADETGASTRGPTGRYNVV